MMRTARMRKQEVEMIMGNDCTISCLFVVKSGFINKYNMEIYEEYFVSMVVG